jgi:flagellar motor switch/type III secretory pathway protein FliN
MPSAGSGSARAAPPLAPPTVQAEAAKPTQGRPTQSKPEPGRPEQAKPEPALMPAPQPAEEAEERRLGPPVSLLPVALAVVVPVRSFRVRNLLALAPGHLIETRWSSGEDLPLAAGQVRLAWSEFEVVETQLAVRITRLA